MKKPVRTRATMSNPFNPDAAWHAMNQTGLNRDVNRKAKQQENYELTIVKTLVQSAGGHFDARQLRQERLSNEQSDLIDLEWFGRAYPGFPIRLRAGKIAWAHKAMATLFINFPKSPIYEALSSFVEDEGLDLNEEAVGFVFQVVKHGDLVLHSLRLPEVWTAQEQPKPRDRASFYFDTDIQGQCYTLETLPRLLKRIGISWY